MPVSLFVSADQSNKSLVVASSVLQHHDCCFRITVYLSSWSDTQYLHNWYRNIEILVLLVMILSLWYHNIHWQIAMALSQLEVPWFSLGQSIKLSSSPVQLTFTSLAGRSSSPNNPPPKPIAPGSVK